MKNTTTKTKLKQLAQNTASDRTRGGALRKFINKCTNAKLVRSRRYAPGERIIAARKDEGEFAYFVSSMRYLNSYENGRSNVGSGAFIVLDDNGNLKAVPSVHKISDDKALEIL